MQWTIDLDVAVDVPPGHDAGDAVAAWAAEFAPGCDVRVLVNAGPAGGWPSVRLSSTDRDALEDALGTYAGRDGVTVAELVAAVAHEHGPEDAGLDDRHEELQRHLLDDHGEILVGRCESKLALNAGMHRRRHGVDA